MIILDQSMTLLEFHSKLAEYSGDMGDEYKKIKVFDLTWSKGTIKFGKNIMPKFLKTMRG